MFWAGSGKRVSGTGGGSEAHDDVKEVGCFCVV